jgi:ElaB/YqjD/DUF883 family membrane-anchored ribosome-binding protein
MDTTSNASVEGQGGQSSAVGNPGGSIQEAMESSRTRLTSAYAAMQERSNQMLEGAEGYIQRAPFQSVIYAASIGAVIGLVAGLIIGERSGGSWHSRWW